MPTLRIRLSEFPNQDVVFDNLQGLGPRGDIDAARTHEGMLVHGDLPTRALPPHVLVMAQQEEEDNAGGSQQMAAAAATSGNVFLQPPPRDEQQHQQQQQQGQQSSACDATPSSSSPPKTLGWLHRVIEDFFEFRARQFTAKANNPSSGAFYISDETDKVSRMIVPSPITDDVAFHLFEMISERYGVASVVQQQCAVALQTSKFFATRDVTAALFHALLKNPSFDSNDIRFLVEAKRCMRSSLVSQRGVDGVLRWFIPLRVVPHVLRKACDHPWARQVLFKVHSALDGLMGEQQRRRREQEQQQQQNEAYGRGGGARGGAPLFTLPSPQNLILVPPYDSHHPLVGRGPYVDLRGSEEFLATQPRKLVIGADYLLCMLFCNWIDHRDSVLADSAEGRPIRAVINRRKGKVSCALTVDEVEAVRINKLSMFAVDVAENNNVSDAENRNSSWPGQEQQQTPTASSFATLSSPSSASGDASSSSLMMKEGQDPHHQQQTAVDGTTATKQQQQQQQHQQQQNTSRTNSGPARRPLVPPRLLHLYTKNPPPVVEAKEQFFFS